MTERSALSKRTEHEPGRAARVHGGLVAMPPWRHLPRGGRFLASSPGVAAPPVRRCVFLDRDSVIVEDVHFLTTVEQLRVLPGVAEALQRLQEQFYLVVVTNQSGIARGLLTEDDLFDIHAELVERLAAEAVVIDAFYYCPHLPEATVGGYDVECDCRKPRPGMLLRAAQDWDIDLPRSFMVGDQPRDAEAGTSAGARSVLLGSADGSVPDLAAAAALILSESTADREGPAHG